MPELLLHLIGWLCVALIGLMEYSAFRVIAENILHARWGRAVVYIVAAFIFAVVGVALALLMTCGECFGQCATPSDTIVAGTCEYTLEDPHIQPGETVTRCFTLISESDNVTPGYVFVQTPACGPAAYVNLSYAVYSSDCSTTIGTGNIFPFPSNPTTFLPDTSVDYVLCLTWTALCELSAFCPTYDFSPLPVELLAFGWDVVGKTIALKWTTGSETGSSHFILRRSADLVEWKQIGIIGASGYSQGLREYSMTDQVPMRGVNYYRLIEVDLDGASSSYDVIAVYFDSEANPGWLYWYTLDGKLR